MTDEAALDEAVRRCKLLWDWTEIVDGRPVRGVPPSYVVEIVAPAIRTEYRKIIGAR